MSNLSESILPLPLSLTHCHSLLSNISQLRAYRHTPINMPVNPPVNQQGASYCKYPMQQDVQCCCTHKMRKQNVFECMLLLIKKRLKRQCARTATRKILRSGVAYSLSRLRLLGEKDCFSRH